MKSIIKLMVVFVCVVSLVACGKKDTTVSAWQVRRADGC